MIPIPRDAAGPLGAAALLALLGLAAACTLAPPGGEAETAAPAAEATASKTSEAAPAGDQGTQTQTQAPETAGAGDTAAAPGPALPALDLMAHTEPARPPAAEPPALPGPEDLVGLQPGGVGALFGEPVFKRVDPPAQVWQYSDGSCILDVFLYQKSDGGPYKVTYAEARGRSVAKVPWKDCVLHLLKHRQGHKSG